MDRRDENTLRKITRNIPDHLARNVVREVVDDSQEHLAIAALNSRHISDEKKAVLRKSLERGDFRRVTTEENPEAIQQLDRYHEREIARARAQGVLGTPKMDKFERGRVAAAQRRGQQI